MVDCPGLEDSDPAKEFPNIDSIHYIMKHAKSVKILYLIDQAQMTHKGGADFITGLSKFVSLLTEEGVENANSFILPILTKAEFKRNGEKVIEGSRSSVLYCI